MRRWRWRRKRRAHGRELAAGVGEALAQLPPGPLLVVVEHPRGDAMDAAIAVAEELRRARGKGRIWHRMSDNPALVRHRRRPCIRLGRSRTAEMKGAVAGG